MTDYNSLMEARIQFGDNVAVIMSDEDGNWHAQEVVVVNVPGGPGDLWQFQRPNGLVFAANPYHGSFIGIEKVSSG